MKTSTAFLSLIILFSILIVIVLYRSENVFYGHETKQNIVDFENILRISNHPQNTTTLHLVQNPDIIAALESVIQQKEKEIDRLTLELKSLANGKNLNDIETNYSNFAMDVHSPDCELRYGMSLVSNWRQSAENWCSPIPGPGISSSLTCYPYRQKHKHVADIFCEAKNFVIDFSGIDGNPVSSGKPPKGQEYLKFSPKSTRAKCSRTNNYNQVLFMNHQRLQMSQFEALSSQELDFDELHDQITYLLARDEDCENLFHSTADFMNMFLVLSVLNLSPTEIQLMLFDRFTNGPYEELLRKAFSPNHPIIRHHFFKKKKILFRHIIFHLESPAALIFPKVANPDPLRCFSTGLFQSYRKHILESFGLLHVHPPPIPSVMLSLRRRSKEKNVGRVMANEQEVENVLKNINMANYKIVDTALIPFGDQLKMIRNTNILVGIHGAGLMLIMFAAEEAVLVEIHPSYRQDRHFRHAARMTNKIYMPLRSTSRETCVGSSDNVVVPIEEFRATMDGALRIARQFDDGISECGLRCPGEILALDHRLDKYYKPHEIRKPPINTQFPCN